MLGIFRNSGPVDAVWSRSATRFILASGESCTYTDAGLIQGLQYPEHYLHPGQFLYSFSKRLYGSVGICTETGRYRWSGMVSSVLDKRSENRHIPVSPRSSSISQCSSTSLHTQTVQLFQRRRGRTAIMGATHDPIQEVHQ